MDINGTGKIVEQFGPFERAKIGAAADFVCVKYAVGFVAHLIEQVIFKDELDLGVFIGAQRRTVRENVVEGGISCGRSLCIWLRFNAADGDVQLVFILLSQRQEKRCTAAGVHKAACFGECGAMRHGSHLVL